jgi:hypothetical protein
MRVIPLQIIFQPPAQFSSIFVWHMPHLIPFSLHATAPTPCVSSFVYNNSVRVLTWPDIPNIQNAHFVLDLIHVVKASNSLLCKLTPRKANKYLECVWMEFSLREFDLSQRILESCCRRLVITLLIIELEPNFLDFFKYIKNIPSILDDIYDGSKTDAAVTF